MCVIQGNVCGPGECVCVCVIQGSVYVCDSGECV